MDEWTTEKSLPLPRPRTRHVSTDADDAVRASLNAKPGKGILAKVVPGEADAKLLARRLRHAARKVGAEVTVRSELVGDSNEVKVYFEATRPDPAVPVGRGARHASR